MTSCVGASGKRGAGSNITHAILLTRTISYMDMRVVVGCNCGGSVIDVW